MFRFFLFHRIYDAVDSIKSKLPGSASDALPDMNNIKDKISKMYIANNNDSNNVKQVDKS